jgi:hypothetical protein
MNLPNEYILTKEIESWKGFVNVLPAGRQKDVHESA